MEKTLESNEPQNNPILTKLNEIFSYLIKNLIKSGDQNAIVNMLSLGVKNEANYQNIMKVLLQMSEDIFEFYGKITPSFDNESYQRAFQSNQSQILDAVFFSLQESVSNNIDLSLSIYTSLLTMEHVFTWISIELIF